MTAVSLPVVDSGPESLFRIGPVSFDGETVRVSMPTGPWLTGPDGSALPGSIGVLADNALGYVIIGSRPPDHWSVSTEISLDLVGSVPLDGSRVHAEARVLQSDRSGGLSVGQVTDDAGRLVAVGRQRGRFVPAMPETGLVSTRFDVDDLMPSVQGLLSARLTPQGLAVEVAEPLQNPMHNLHGGITLALADLAATHALDDGGPRLVTSSIHAVYARGIPAGSRLDVAATVQHRGRTLATVEVLGRVDGRVSTITRVTAAAPPLQ
jgi:uncharacterized protein (TIGR00369 family)